MSKRACRVACVQLFPLPGQVKQNEERVRELTKDIVAGSLDILMLPEMALTGYIFADKAAIESLLENPYDASSPSLQLAKELAIRMQCYVVIGCPIKTFRSSQETNEVSHYDARPASLLKSNGISISRDEGEKCYNAALLVDARGQLLHVFRKHFNYEDDKRWASEGPGFQNVTLPGLGKICIAICMDLNPYNFEAPFESFELARYCQQEHVDILMMPMAWLMSKEPQFVSSPDTLLEGPDELTINYWATRLMPVLQDDNYKRKFFFVSCNRTGTEQYSKFAGSSCALQFNAENHKSAR